MSKLSIVTSMAIAEAVIKNPELLQGPDITTVATIKPPKVTEVKLKRPECHNHAYDPKTGKHKFHTGTHYFGPKNPKREHTIDGHSYTFPNPITRSAALKEVLFSKHEVAHEEV